MIRQASCENPSQGVAKPCGKAGDAEELSKNAQGSLSDTVVLNPPCVFQLSFTQVPQNYLVVWLADFRCNHVAPRTRKCEEVEDCA